MKNTGSSLVTKASNKWERGIFWIGLAVTFFLFLFLIRAILLPFVIGIFIAYFLDPAADRLQRLGLSRSLATFAIIGLFFISIILISILVIPLLSSQFTALILSVPGYMTQLEARFTPTIDKWLGEHPIGDMETIKAGVADYSGVMLKVGAAFIAGVFQSGMALFNVVSLLLITPVVAYYLLEEWDRIVAHVDSLLPRAHAATVRSQLAIIDSTLSGFLRGQLNVCLILCVFYTVILSALGLHFSIVIGIVTGLLIIIPYAGWMLGVIIGVTIAIFQYDNFNMVGAIAGVFIAGAALEQYFLTPRLVGEKVGLHPVWIIFGMLAGAALFGFVGILLAVPVTAVIGVLLRFAMQRYLLSSYYRGEPVVIPGPIL